MVVGVLRVELRLHGNDSLKGKRSVIRPILERTRQKFHCSAAETALNDAHGAAELGFAVVGNDAGFVSGCLDRIGRYVESLHLAEVVSEETEILNLS